MPSTIRAAASYRIRPRRRRRNRPRPNRGQAHAASAGGGPGRAGTVADRPVDPPRRAGDPPHAGGRVGGRPADLRDRPRLDAVRRPADAPGVFVQPRFGADEARISIRGSGIQRTFHGRGIVLLQDGVPLNLADGSFDMQAVEPLGLQYIEVFRGANALQYGATTLGGAINFVANTGFTPDLLRLRGELGSFGYYKGFVSNGGGRTTSTGTSRRRTPPRTATATGPSSRARAPSATSAGASTRTWRRVLSHRAQQRFAAAGDADEGAAEPNPRQANAGNLAGRQKRDFPLYRIANKTTYRSGFERSRRRRSTRTRTCGIRSSSSSTRCRTTTASACAT